MINLVAGTLMILGSLVACIASIGILRMPDFLMRMHAGTKAGTLGVGLIMLASACHFATFSVFTKSLITILFIFITVPIGAQMLGRAAYFINLPLSNRTITDELRNHYNKESHELLSD